jgi:hypothetical protein
LLRAQLTLQQGIAQLAVAIALDRVAPGDKALWHTPVHATVHDLAFVWCRCSTGI